MGAASFAVFARRDAFPLGMKETTKSGVRCLEQAYGPWPDARTAMADLADQDRYENGHMTPDNVGGKHDLIHIATVDDTTSATAMANRLMEDGDARIQDKRGPAGCITIRTGKNAYMFFGNVATWRHHGHDPDGMPTTGVTCTRTDP